MRMAWRNFIRNTRSTAIAVLAVAAMTAFLLIYADNIRLSGAELDNAYETIPVEAYIAGQSANAAPRISEEIYASIINSGYVADSSAAARCGVGEKDTLMGIDNLNANVELKGYADGIEWLDGYDGSVFGGGETVCVVLRSAGYGLGDSVKTALRARPDDRITLTVVGLYDGMESLYGDVAFYCPLAALRTLMLNNGLAFNYCALEMTLCNTRSLDVFKADMKALGLEDGPARLVINDAILISATKQLSRQIRLLTALLPLLFLLITAIGFALSFLLLRNRRREAAVMRSLGARRMQVVASLLTETFLQAILGAAAGALCAALSTGVPAGGMPYAIISLFCYTAGGAVAAFGMAGANVIRLMSAKE